MKIESHLENLKESISEINTAVMAGVTNKQRTLGFHTSAAAIDMLEIILHQNNLIDPGFVIKHEWFNSSKRLGEKIPFDFRRKKEIISLVAAIEAVRNKLCYGKRQEEEVLISLVKAFSQLKQLFVEVSGYEL